jgi:dephospho-CoA kinase
MQVVAFTGMPGSGKSEAVEIARKRGLPIVTMGDFVRDTVKARGLPGTDENLGRIATEMRREKGADHWAHMTCDHILRTHQAAPLVVIDGVRTLAEIQTFRKRLGQKFHLVAIRAPDELRAERLRRRQRTDDSLDLAKFAQRDQREIGWGILEAIASAETIIDNTPPLEDFRRQVGDVFAKLTSMA